MSIIGEIWEAEYDSLQNSIPITLAKFANWLADNDYTQIGYDLWAVKTGLEMYGDTGKVYYRTHQLVDKFLKEYK